MAPRICMHAGFRGRGAWYVSEARPPARGRAALDTLVACAQAGDAQAFRRMTEQLTPRLVRYVSIFLRGDLHTAQDVVQDAFIAAWRKIDTIRDGGHLVPWLYKVARCKAITWLRRRGPRGSPMDSIERANEIGQEVADPDGRDPARLHLAGPESKPLVRALRRAIAQLPPMYAGVVRLHYLRGHATHEVARLLGLPRTTVKMRLFRARQKLRKMLEDAP